MSNRQQGLYIGGEFIGKGRQARGGLIILGGYAILAGTVTVLVMAWMFQTSIAPVLFWTGSAAGAALVVFIILAGVLKLRAILFDTMAQQQMTALSIERQRLENDALRIETEQKYHAAPYMVVKQNETLIHLPDRSIAVYPARIEQQAEAAALPAPEPIPLDFFDALSDHRAAYAIIGPQRSGKTYAAMHLTDHFANRNIARCIFIGMKAEPGEWVNTERHIGETAIRKALQNILSSLNQRHEQQVRAPRLALFLDDWINIAAVCEGLAEEFFTRAATDMVSAGIIPYFLLQSDSNADWGNRKGAMLKNNFVKLTLTPVRNARGQIDHTQTRATLSWPGDTLPRPVLLPTGMPALGSIGQPEPESFVLPPTPEFESVEDKVLWDLCHAHPGESFTGLFKEYLKFPLDEHVSKTTFIRRVKSVVERYDLGELDIGDELPIRLVKPVSNPVSPSGKPTSAMDTAVDSDDTQHTHAS